MKELDVNTWNRKEHFEHFSKLKDPYFGITIPFNVTKAYALSKDKKVSFFGTYLHACMQAINGVENLKYRIVDDKVVIFNTINASATIMRENKTFGFSYIDYNENLDLFLSNFQDEKQRINTSSNLFPPKNGLDCIHCSALPWSDFSGHKEPVSGLQESVPKLAFGKMKEVNNEKIMNVAINVNHALVDGYHLSLFSELFQKKLNK